MDDKERYKCIIEIKYKEKYYKKIFWGEKIEELCKLAKNEVGLLTVKIYDYKHMGWLVVNLWD